MLKLTGNVTQMVKFSYYKIYNMRTSSFTRIKEDSSDRFI